MKVLNYLFTEQQVNDRLFWLRLMLAAIMAILLVGQLFTYENFYDVLSNSQTNMVPVVMVLMMTLLPLYELIALPALLSMTLSRDLVRVSAYVARAVVVLLAFIVLNGIFVAPGESTGLLGDTVSVPANILTLIVVNVYAGAVWFATAKQVERPSKK